jgi:signal transduction histidine kinase
MDEGLQARLEQGLAQAAADGTIESLLALPKGTAFLFVDDNGQITEVWGARASWQRACEGRALSSLLVSNATRAPRALTELFEALAAGRAADIFPLFFDGEDGAPDIVRIIARPQQRNGVAGHRLCLLDESHLWKALDTAMATVQSQSALAETVPAPLLVLDPQGRIEILNDALARLLGLPEGGLLQRPLSALERWARLPEGMLSEAINDALDPEGASEGRPLRLRDEQGNPHWLVPAAAPLQQPDGARTMVLFTEVTHFEMSKQAQVDTEREAALNLLSQSILHDLNNVMTVISAASRLLDQPSAYPTAKDDLAAAVEGAKQLIARLRDRELGRPRRAEHQSLAEAIRLVCEGFRATLRSDVMLEVGSLIEAGIFAPPGDFQRALLNLLKNGAEAIEGRGVITVSSNWLKPGEQIQILVTDSGRGMVPSERARVFEPYFSTKTGNEDRGLGLTQVARMAASAGGEVEVKSSAPGETVLALTLPAQPSVFYDRVDSDA